VCLERNCNHFAEDLCKRLCGSGIPSWVNRAASIGNLFSGLVPGLGQSNPVPTPESAGPAETGGFVAFTGTKKGSFFPDVRVCLIACWERIGSGMTVTGKKLDEKSSSKSKGPKEETADARRQKMLDAALKRTSMAAAAAADAT
jgi:hypothetical protein